MFRHIANLRLPAKLTALLLFLSGISTALADQITFSYVDTNSQAQTLTVDANSSAEDLALAADLAGEYGVGITHDPDNGAGTLAEIAAALAGAAPIFAADIALALATLSPEDTDAIVAAVNAVPGVNTQAVLVAVHCVAEASMAGTLPEVHAVPEVRLMTCFPAPPAHEPAGSGSVLSLELTAIERVSSPN